MINSRSEVNLMTLANIVKLDLITQKTNVCMQKIDSSALEIYKIVVMAFLVEDRLKKV